MQVASTKFLQFGFFSLSFFFSCQRTLSRVFTFSGTSIGNPSVQIIKKALVGFVYEHTNVLIIHNSKNNIASSVLLLFNFAFYFAIQINFNILNESLLNSPSINIISSVEKRVCECEKGLHRPRYICAFIFRTFIKRMYVGIHICTLYMGRCDFII